MKKYFLSFIAVLNFFSISAQNWSISTIPLNLKNNADAVIRVDETEFIIENLSKSITKKHWVVSIFNAKGEEEFATFRSEYDKFSKIKSISGSIYDSKGTLLKKLKSSEINDFGLVSDGAEVSDNRAKVAEFDKKYYPFPYTVEFSYEKENTNMLFYDSWHPITFANVGLEKSKFTVKSPEANTYKKKEFNLQKNPNKTQIEKYFVETWELSNQEPIQIEENSKYEILTKVLLAPNDYFTIDGHKGKMNTWEDLGKFYFDLNKGRDLLPAETIVKLKNFVGNETNPKKVTQKVYQFMQSHTRYVSIQLGVGGWQTAPAQEVALKGYGDCKALTNYTIALLKQMGITAYNAIISAGENSYFDTEDFVSSRFNHVIAFVPLKQDTIWLECTNQKSAFGYLGDFTGNRKALIAMEKGSKLVNTKSYLPEENTQNRKAVVALFATGDASINLKTIYSGIQQETRSYIHQNYNKKDKEDWIIKKIPLASAELSKYEFSNKSEIIPTLEENLEFNSLKFASISGPRMFVKLNSLTTFFSNPEVKETRKTDLFLNPNSYNFYDVDTVIYKIPENYEIEYLPKDIDKSSKFGDFSSKVINKNTEVLYIRKVILKGGMFDKSFYNEWVEFVKFINKTDLQKMVLKRKV
jgi:hypothetical protein